MKGDTILIDKLIKNESFIVSAGMGFDIKLYLESRREIHSLISHIDEEGQAVLNMKKLKKDWNIPSKITEVKLSFKGIDTALQGLTECGIDGYAEIINKAIEKSLKN